VQDNGRGGATRPRLFSLVRGVALEETLLGPNKINGLTDSISDFFNERRCVNDTRADGLFEKSGQKSSKIFAIFFEENWG
jgi:hypothetical protein